MRFESLPPFLLEILRSGGLVSSTRKRFQPKP
jgi:hypothetical protein